MRSRDDALFAGAALAGFLLAAFQIWYVALPLEQAAHADFCRWTEYLDCFESLQKSGAALLPVLAALAAVFFLEAGLAGLAFGAEPPRSDAWRSLARLATFPASGLAVYLLLSDYLDLKKTSPSAVLLVLLSVAQNVQVVVRGKLAVRLRDAGFAPLALAGGAVVLWFFLEGAPGAAREADAAETVRALAPPAVILPDFEQQIPRQGAVPLGETRAPHEVLLFLDPAQEASRNLLKEALELKDEDVLVQVYLKDRPLAPGSRAVLKAVARGDPLPPEEPSTLPERWVKAAKLKEYPTAIWKGGRQDGAVTLASVLAAIRSAKQ